MARKHLSPDAPPLSPLPPIAAPMPVRWRLVLGFVVAAYLGLGAAHIQVTPVAPDTSSNYINAPDEAAHLIYVRAMAEKGHIPVLRDPEFPTYEWHQPPLYYSLVSVADRGGPKAVRWATLLLGLLGIGVIFLASRRIFPDDPAIAVLSAAFAALLPMRQAITSSVGNDVLIELLFSATLLVIARGFYGGFTTARAILLGCCIGMALAAKANGILLIPVTLAALVYIMREGESRNAVVRGFAWAALFALLLPAGWYVRNYQLYHELTPVKAFAREFEHTKRAEDLIGRRGFTADPVTGEMQPEEEVSRTEYLGLLANWTYRTFWAAYTPSGAPATLGLPFFMPPAFYLLTIILFAPAIIGLIHLHRRRKIDLTTAQVSLIRLLFITLFLALAAFAGFTWTYFQAQGRYLYPAMLPISVLWSAGFRAALPERYRDTGTISAIAVLFLLSVAFLFVGILPAYASR